jgi:hypothetical protein
MPLNIDSLSRQLYTGERLSEENGVPEYQVYVLPGLLVSEAGTLVTSTAASRYDQLLTKR